MRILIVEDEMTCSLFFKQILNPYGTCDIANDGDIAIKLFQTALDDGEPYDLICMDIISPKIDGQSALREIREIEKKGGVKVDDRVKVVMITALEDQKNVVEAFYHGGASSYIVKPVDQNKLLDELRKMGLIT